MADVACDDNGNVYVSRALHHGSGEIYVDISNDYGQTANTQRGVVPRGRPSSLAFAGAGKVYVAVAIPCLSDFTLTVVDYGNTWETLMALGSSAPASLKTVNDQHIEWGIPVDLG